MDARVKPARDEVESVSIRKKSDELNVEAVFAKLKQLGGKNE